MNNKYLQIAFLIIFAAIALFVIKRKPVPVITDFSSCQTAGGIITGGEPVTCGINGRTFEEQQSAEPEVVVDQPQYGGLVSSPMKVSGKAKGFWFFEATMPVTLKDDQGNVLFQGPAQAQSDWMTADYVPFSVTMTFDPKDAQYGVLIVNKDNPSGDPARDAAYAIPVRFK
ncbi:MAG: Gmad2 immunoglobulin-like domain-containing protein [Candidatus Doudnabacteria bacterium]